MYQIKQPIYQSQQIREFERLALERFNITPSILMQRAGKAAFDFLQRRWPQAHKIVVFCGGGNNGGDGYVFAHFAHERGLIVEIWQIGVPDPQKPDAYAAFKQCEQANIPMNMFDPHLDLGHPDVIVDALCGIGLHELLKNGMVQAIEKMERSHSPILSIDVPTGIDADNGTVKGAAVHATATITFIGLKLGLLTGSGIGYTGELVMNDLQLPIDLYSYIAPVAEKIQLGCYAHFLKPRPRDWHKGLSGHVLVIGGDYGFSGAPRMAAEAALRVGAGLVTIATRPLHALTLNVTRPELMCHGIKAATDLDPLLEKADVLILGPGLGKSEWSRALWEKVTHQQTLPMVIDADGLNILSEAPFAYPHWIMTPHPGEAARLLGVTSQAVQQDRVDCAKEICKRYNGTCVLKGAGSLVVAPNSLPALCDKGNPGMASAGMGDVLSGVIGGILAQGVPLGEAAKLGVCMHAIAGDLAAKEGERGLLASDLMPFLRRLANNTAG